MKFNLSDLIDLNLARQFFVCAHHANGLMQSRKPEPFQFTEWRRPMAYASVIVEDSGERGVLFRLHHRCGHGVIEVSVQIFLNIVERLERSERYFSAQWIPKGKERGDKKGDKGKAKSGNQGRASAVDDGERRAQSALSASPSSGSAAPPLPSRRDNRCGALLQRVRRQQPNQ